ncbi:hypothetical protein A3H10_01060 [Candidatus Uhrbacteria bacterium RIFCSPLOWO2_12_FULL_46_10]|uniref:PEP-utilising enzyme mobile domain-containing protein n=1 Tax=Candidatus Uhrbacteria bacterium RIFCSPLOWO2_01_FULL_47_25 TaxID=1802402 RepID=A0A1F7UWQ4_9BACT|nr:MAG: Phosphoenolpyruvate synthase/pyruvate phosphate dikinase [Parcubacteria group bacterium GW2011_GWA2_46_9]OGL60196.1 MAG: hypothetical protein A2752_01015 [Candidatus Uhrbacteria bacterium RIFCSPHIGHO2_01_FULL_46_23]OGL69660.1 MAG: hypothetical protein A3D60_02985 [Candidatus Uhrbacteria bacterium RIFCSPHIGHO2_02_FULL_47_29]OGL75890.1 MAG: hypothetical protein A3E96_04915 [Candidatus Uhrbacteria bacterium RIFCSPHIGHO2_12_FULL_46_13]OGL82721.1 MAG: hypothetical protein A2936_04000 [Candid
MAKQNLIKKISERRSKKYKPDWVAKGHLNYEFFTFWAAAKSYQIQMPKAIGFPFNYKYENLDAIYDQNNINEHVKKLSHLKFIKRNINFIQRQIDYLILASKKYGGKKDLNSFGSWYKVFQKFLPSFGLVLGLEEALEKKVKNFLSNDDFYKIAFAEETATSYEQKSILRISLLKRNSRQFNKSLKEHLKKFDWMGNKLMTYTPFTKADVISRTCPAGEAKRKLKEMEENRNNLGKGALEVYKKLNKKQLELVSLYRKVLSLRTDRADAVAQAASLTYSLFDSLANELNLKREELMRFSFDEIMEMYKTEKILDSKKRLKYHAVSLNEKIKVFWGNYGEEEKKINKKEIRGVVACKGYARGQVKVIIDIPDLIKVKTGDILVSSYTNPNMVPAMERAVAIITNIGGLTSHAAIVAREMNKPCIIGTKIATQVFKDGDLVEVDANKGVVRKLK